MLLNTTIFQLDQIFKRATFDANIQVPAKVPRFSCFVPCKDSPNGWKPKESLLKSHLEFTMMNLEKAMRGEIFITVAQNDLAERVGAVGKPFIRIYDNVAIPEDTSIKSIPCVFSFQQHVYGNFVVIRNNLKGLETELVVQDGNEKGKQIVELYGHSFDARTGELQ